MLRTLLVILRFRRWPPGPRGGSPSQPEGRGGEFQRAPRPDILRPAMTSRCARF